MAMSRWSETLGDMKQPKRMMGNTAEQNRKHEQVNCLNTDGDELRQGKWERQPTCGLGEFGMSPF